MTAPTDLTRLSAFEAASKIERGELKPSHYIKAHIDRITEREPLVGAFEALNTQAALDQAKQMDSQSASGMLFGIPIGVKDLIDTKDFVTTYGSPIYRGHRPVWDAPCVVQAKEQGAVVMGKTVTTEFAIFHPGKTANPHNLKHTPGGSSSGSAAAVADFMLPLAFATQTAASTYRPASFCGVVGYKPTFGTINRFGAKQLADSLDTIGTMSRSVRDASLFAAAAARRPGLLVRSAGSQAPSIGICETHEWPFAQKESREALYACAKRLESRGAKVKSLGLPAEFSQLVAAQTDVMVAESYLSLSYEYHYHRDQLSAKLLQVLEEGRAISEERLADCYALIGRCRLALKDVFSTVDLLLSPAAVGEAPVGLSATGDPVLSRMWTALGNPGLSLPWSKGPNGLPVGVLLTAFHHQDQALLQAAAWAEAQRES